MQRYFFLLVAVSVLFLVGCRTPQTVKDAWKGTRSYYYEYLNTPAKIDMDDKGNILDYQAALGSSIADFDMRLQELERAMQNSDQRPDANWARTMSGRFPWLSGIALTDEYGFPQAHIPPHFAKSFDINPLLEVDPKQQIKDLRAFVQNDPLGPEIYIGNPVYIGADFKGIIAVHFDPRALLARTGDAAKVIISGPNGIIWPGIYVAEATPIAHVDWVERVKSEVYGVEKNNLGSFYWVCRYIGNLPLIYAIRVEGDFPINEENMRGLAEANTFALGAMDMSQLQPSLNVQPNHGTPPADITPDGSNSPLTAPGHFPDNVRQDATPLSN